MSIKNVFLFYKKRVCIFQVINANKNNFELTLMTLMVSPIASSWRCFRLRIDFSFSISLIQSFSRCWSCLNDVHSSSLRLKTSSFREKRRRMSECCWLNTRNLSSISRLSCPTILKVWQFNVSSWSLRIDCLKERIISWTSESSLGIESTFFIQVSHSSKSFFAAKVWVKFAYCVSASVKVVIHS